MTTYTNSAVVGRGKLAFDITYRSELADRKSDERGSVILSDPAFFDNAVVSIRRIGPDAGYDGPVYHFARRKGHPASFLGVSSSHEPLDYSQGIRMAPRDDFARLRDDLSDWLAKPSVSRRERIFMAAVLNCVDDYLPAEERVA